VGRSRAGDLEFDFLAGQMLGTLSQPQNILDKDDPPSSPPSRSIPPTSQPHVRFLILGASSELPSRMQCPSPFSFSFSR
jgi:hypothetical protein